MRKSRPEAVRLLLLTLLIVTHVNVTGAAEPAFFFEESLKFTFPLPDASADTISFLVFSKEGTITGASVRVRDVKGPGGQSLGPNVVASSQLPDQIPEEGSRTSLKLNPTLLRQPGEYRIILQFTGTGPGKKALKAMVTPAVVVPAAEINIEEVKGQTFELQRCCPWGKAGQTFRLYLQEILGKSEIKNPQVSGQAIFFKETKIRAPGQVIVAALPEDVQPAGPGAGQVMTLDVKFDGLEKTGTFDTAVVVISPSLGGRKVVPLRLTVTDPPLWPFVVIFLGVLGGFLTNYFSRKWRPRQLNRSTILRLRNEISRYRRAVKSPDNTEKIEGLWSRLRAAEDTNEVGDAAKVTTQLEQIEKDLDEFQKAQAKAGAEAQGVLNSLRNQVDAYAMQFPNDEKDLAAIRAMLDDAERLLKQDQTDYASEKLAAATASFTAMKKQRLTRYIEELEAQFNTLKEQTSAPDQAEAEKLRVAARTLLNQDKLEEARAKLAEFKLALETLDTKRRARGARETFPLEFSPAPQLEAPPDRARIVIGTPPEQRTTDIDINFDVIDPQGLLREGDLFRWNFGEPKSQTDNGKTITYRYREYGNYEVRVEVLRGGQVPDGLSLAEPIKVLPGQTERERLRIRDSIQMSDIALSAIALVLAAVTGLLFLYVGKTFGSLSDYLLALLWGFGIDNSVRGFAGVMGKITSSGGKE